MRVGDVPVGSAHPIVVQSMTNTDTADADATAIQVARIGIAVARGQGDLGTGTLWQPLDVLIKRVGMVVVTIAFILLLQVLGLTLSLFLSMAAALWLMGVRRVPVLLGISFGVAAAAYLLFIAVLDAGFPHGVIEKLFS